MGNVLVDFDGVISTASEGIRNSYRTFHEWDSVEDCFAGQPTNGRAVYQIPVPGRTCLQYYCLWKTVRMY